MAVAWRWLLIFELAACIERGAFPCSKDDQCGMGGTCEAGYCSAEDSDCESGRRYSIYAPEGIGGQCVASRCALALGRAHGCVRDDNGDLRCWGKNSSGQLGDGQVFDLARPSEPIAKLAGSRSIASGDEHTCAIAANGEIYCWGFGQLEPTAVDGISGADALAAGGDRTCALVAGGVWCWTQGERKTPSQAKGLSDAVEVTTGDAHTCARTRNAVYCWGAN